VFAVLAALGVILGAVYMLWLYQRLIFGGITHEANRRLTDLSGREIALLVPMVVLMFWIGIYPGTFLRQMDAASAHLFEQMRGKQVLAWQAQGRLVGVDRRATGGPTLELQEAPEPWFSTAGERRP
jgi:NADH-quinone oxidoreductase subunit M